MKTLNFSKILLTIIVLLAYSCAPRESLSPQTVSPAPTPEKESHSYKEEHQISSNTATETDFLALNKPWTREESTIIIDAYEGNPIDWKKMATDKKVTAVIHRSSIGTRVDTLYESRKKIALEKGYLWGAYHLGRRGNTIAQADLFIKMTAHEPETLMILDLEDTGSASFMSIEESILFMEYVYEKTGRIPVVYANHSTLKMLNTKVKDHPIFLQSKFWYARFKATVTDYQSAIWPNYFMWQFSSEINCKKVGACLYNVPGVLADMDINVYNGNARELASEWSN